MANRDLEDRIRSIIGESLQEKVADADIGARERALSELVEIRPDRAGNFFFVRKGAPKDAELISSSDRVVVDGLYDWKRARKRRRYLQLKADTTYTRPIMVAEGDSWFEHPLYPDMLDWAGKEFAVLSLAKAGDTWSDMIDQDTDPPKHYPDDGSLMGLTHVVAEENKTSRPPKTVLLSAGGNDLIGQIAQCVYPYDPARSEDDYINHTEFDKILSQVVTDYRAKSAEVIRMGKIVLVHSYDYPNPQDNGQFIGFPLKKYRNIPGVGLMRRIVNQMIDLFSNELITLARNSNDKIHFINLRETIGTRDIFNGPDQRLWSDEMHGNQFGYELLWKKLRVGIEAHAESFDT
jgi:hypothetical protein